MERGPQPLPLETVRASLGVLDPLAVVTPAGHEWLRSGAVDDQLVAVFPSDQAGRSRCVGYLHQHPGREAAAEGCLAA
eukprot:11662359-Alexandrium_andersonii.AAC.1